MMSPKERKKYNADYYKRNRKLRKQISKSWKEKSGYYKKMNEQRKADRKAIFSVLGGKCVNPFNLPHPDWCNDKRCLQIDHVNGNGPKDRKKYKEKYGMFAYYTYILNKIKDGSKEYQLLCANCNWIKRFVQKEHRVHVKQPIFKTKSEKLQEITEK